LLSLINQATTDRIEAIADWSMRAVKSIRLKDYDYSSDGFYFITICTNYRRPYLTGRSKEIVAQSIEQLSRKMRGVRADYYQIMPSHIHLILVLEECQLRLSEIVRRLKAVTSKQVGFRLWQPNYYEHVIRGDKALAGIRAYVHNNPLIEKL
jgi:putative transposase